MLADPGATGASMDEIAAAAGVTKPVLYRHFPSKQSLVLEVLSDATDRLSEALRHATDQADGSREQVEAGIGAFFHFIEAEPGLSELLFSNQVWRQSGFAEELERFQIRMAEQVSLLLDVPGLDDSSRRFLGAAIVGMCDHSARMWLREGFTPSAEERARDLAEMAWLGLRGIQARS